MTESNKQAAPATPAAVPKPVTVRPPYSRDRWERDLFATKLPSHVKLVGLALAHLGGSAGYIEAGHVQGPRELARTLSMPPRTVDTAKEALASRGFIRRPPSEGWTERACRPITLMLQSGRRKPGGHTGGRP